MLPGVLELAQLRERHCVAEMDVGARRVDAEFDPQRPVALELSLQLALGQHVDGVADQPAGGLRGRGHRSLPALGNVTRPMLDCAPGSEGPGFAVFHRRRRSLVAALAPPLAGPPRRRDLMASRRTEPRPERAEDTEPKPDSKPEPVAFETSEIEFEFDSDPEFVPGRRSSHPEEGTPEPASAVEESANGDPAGSTVTPAPPRDRRTRRIDRELPAALRRNGARAKERGAGRPPGGSLPPPPAPPALPPRGSRPRLKKLRVLLRPRRPRDPGHGLDRLRDDDGGLPGPAGDLRLRPVQGLEEQRRPRRPGRADRDPDQQTRTGSCSAPVRSPPT